MAKVKDKTSATSVKAWNMLRKRRLDRRSRGVHGEKPYVILLEVLFVVKKDVLLIINYI